jgi:hypothetical protein
LVSWYPITPSSDYISYYIPTGTTTAIPSPLLLPALTATIDILTDPTLPPPSIAGLPPLLLLGHVSLLLHLFLSLQLLLLLLQLRVYHLPILQVVLLSNYIYECPLPRLPLLRHHYRLLYLLTLVYLQYLEPVEESLRQLLPEILERGDTEADILPLLSKEAHD